MPGDGQGAPVPHGVFGGLVTDITPPLTIEGLSPDCQDIVFLPGQWKQREGLAKLFALALGENPVYQKTFLQPDENPLNLYLDAINQLYKEDVNATLGTRTLVSTLPASGITVAQSATVFGREYLACSDGKHGVHVPLQYDGTHLDRVSQDGPAEPVVATEENVSFPIVASPGGTNSAPACNITGISEVGNIVTLTADGAPMGFEYGAFGNKVGQLVEIAGVGGGYDGIYTIETYNYNVGTQVVTITFTSGTPGLPPLGAGGTMQLTMAKIIMTVSTAGLSTTRVRISGVGVSGYNGTYSIAAASFTFGAFYIFTTSFGLAASGDGTVSLAGGIGSGIHNVVVLYLTRQGYITKPSPTASWTATGGRVIVTDIPNGPSNVVARILAFTGAGGNNYFYIPTSFTIPGSLTAVESTVIPNNTQTTATIDFSDNALFAATSIDVAGRNYFAQVVLGEVLGFFPYASRLFTWGERNKIQSLLNMGFEAGHNLAGLAQPPGWNVGGGGGGLLTGGGAWGAGLCWQITDDGSAGRRGEISQTFYQNNLGNAIGLPLTRYMFRLWARCLSSGAGSIHAQISSASTGFSATAVIPISSLATNGGFVEMGFSADTPDVIPSDMLFTVWESGSANGTITLLDELNVIFNENPYRDALFRSSYVNAPEQFDGVTGVLGSTSDFTPIRNCFQLRNTMYFNTEIGKNSTTDNGTGEPSTWLVPGVTQSVGSFGVHGSDPGRVGTGESAEQWQFTIAPEGVYVFAGGEDMKVSQEIQKPTANGFPGWDSINQAAIASSWIKNDTGNRRCYIGVPTGTATAPNVVFVLDYRNLDSAWAIANSPPYRNFGNRVLAQDIARKWTRWSLSFNCAEILSRGAAGYQVTFGAGNAETPGDAAGFGNSYQLDAAKLTDDDYGLIVPYRFTHFFPTPDSRAQFRLGAHRLLATYLTALVSGVGLTSITPVVNTLSNAWDSLTPYPLNPNQTFDFEWDIAVDGERIAFKVGSVPNEGETDNAITMQDLNVTLKKDPWSPVRGTMLA